MARFDCEARNIFTALNDIMCLIKNDDAILKADVKVFAEFFLDNVIVWHKNDVCASSSVFHREVWADDLLFSHLMQILDVEWVPRHVLGCDISIFEVHARIDGLLYRLTSRVECMSSVHVYGGVDAEMVSGSQDDCSRFECGISELFLHLRQLTMGSGGVNDLW